MLVTNIELQRHAREGKFAIGAFNTNNLEITKAIIKAANDLRSPLIISCSPSALKYAGLKTLSALVLTEINSTEIPIAFHLDHGTEISEITGCVESGFSSVMMDGSKHELDKNIEITRQAAEMAHGHGLSIEGELGKIMGVEDLVVVSKREASMTDPHEAKKFVEESSVDTLAVSIGNAHGWYKDKPELDFERLQEIANTVDIPLVLHGASGIGEEDIRRSIEIGITKINIDTEIREAFRNGVRDFLAVNPDQIDPRKILAPAIDNMYETVKRKIKLFGSEGKADTILAE